MRARAVPSDVDGPRSPPKPPSPRAKIDRFCVHSTVPSGADTVVSDQITAALPLSQMSVNRVTAIPVPDGGIGPGTDTASLACSTLRKLDVDAGELHAGRFGHVEGLRDVAERRQHLRGVVGQVAQFALVHRIAARTEAQVVELDIATGPREFGGRKLGAERLVEIDRHQFFPAMCSAAR